MHMDRRPWILTTTSSAKLDITVGTVLAVDDIAGSRKSMRLTVDHGNLTRTISILGPLGSGHACVSKLRPGEPRGIQVLRRMRR
jgi:hypothetical protein